MASWDIWLTATVQDLRSRNLFRTLRPTIPGSSPVQVYISAEDLNAYCCGQSPAFASLPSLAQRTDLRTITLFSLNDYLGLSTHPAVCRAAASAAAAYGNGPRSSALVAGYTSHHRELELALAALKGQQECLLFPTGFAANLAVVASLADSSDVAIFSDELNHASIVDGARLARRGGSTLHVYRHNDMEHLEQLLDACPSGQRRLVITDSLFSMDGDYADLPALARLKAAHSFLLAVDDAHGTLVCGARGGGVAEMMGLEDQVDLHIGTLSKAFGCVGGFVACSSQWKDLLVNRGRTQVFSTALPVPVVASAQAALRVTETEPWRRWHLYRLCRQLGAPLGLPTRSPILPVVLGTEAAAVDASATLLRAGFHVPAIRPPTVPAGSSRLRLSLSAGHTSEHVAALLAALGDCGLLRRGLPDQLQDQQGLGAEPDNIVADGSSCEPVAWEWDVSCTAVHVATATRSSGSSGCSTVIRPPKDSRTAVAFSRL